MKNKLREIAESKGREFWILKAHNCVVLEHVPLVQTKDFIHVIEKSEHDKLAAALKSAILDIETLQEIINERNGTIYELRQALAKIKGGDV